ncbi:MAG: histidine phosphatase family protein [Myxococcota bacterium]
MSASLDGSAEPRRIACLMRHAHFDRPRQLASAHLPYPLSSEGRAQAKAAAESVLRAAREQDLAIHPTIETSQLLRAWETGRILAEALEARTGCRFVVEERIELIERGLGSCANLRFDEIEALLARDPRLAPLPPEWRRRADFRLPVPGAESLLDAGVRTARRIDRSLASASAPDAPGGVLKIFVAHGGCLRHAAVVRDILPIDEAIKLTMDYCGTVLIESIGPQRWRHVAGEWKKRLPSTDAEADG